MKSYTSPFWLALTFMAACSFSVSSPAFGQSLTTGGVTGTVSTAPGRKVATSPNTRSRMIMAGKRAHTT